MSKVGLNLPKPCCTSLLEVVAAGTMSFRTEHAILKCVDINSGDHAPAETGTTSGVAVIVILGQADLPAPEQARQQAVWLQLQQLPGTTAPLQVGRHAVSQLVHAVCMQHGCKF